MTDQWASGRPGHGQAGEAVRDRPLFHREGVGPWRARVTVTPIAGLGRLGTQFAVDVAWTGPPLSIPPHAHDAHNDGAPDWDGAPVEASDCYYTPHKELAMAVAGVAVDALAKPRRPDLRAIAQFLTP